VVDKAMRRARLLGSRGCTQVLHAVHGIHPMYSVAIPRSVGCSHPREGGVRAARSTESARVRSQLGVDGVKGSQC
jgi:hypothetical protein